MNQNANPIEDRWITIAEAAWLTSTSERTIGRRIADGSLPSCRIGRSRRINVRALIQS
jgi:excisionase family DNA binding protein